MARDVWLAAAGKLLQRQCYTFLGSRVGLALLFIASVVTLNSVLQVIDGWFSSGIVCPHRCDWDWRDNLQRRSFEAFLGHEPIDVVYTWVNGSDPRLKATLEEWKHAGLPQDAAHAPNATPAAPNASRAANASAAAHDRADASRYQDNQELRYSLRSVEHFAGWVRHIYIVTNGQVPAWLDLNNPRVTVVPHAALFPNHSHLPTFSSPAIEAHLHRIPGLSRRFLYLNDDTFFGNYIRPEDFYTPIHGHRIYLSWAVPDCSPGCTGTWIGDGYCDKACNVSACNFDGGDCLGKAASSYGSNWDNYDYGSYNYHWNPYAQTSCHSGCMDNWIGDKFCDTACNVEACGFDATDCGVDEVRKRLHSFHLSPNLTNYSIDGRLNAFVINLTLGLPAGMEVRAARHRGGGDAIRATALSKPHHLLVIVLKALDRRQPVAFALEGEAHGAHVELNFTVVVGRDRPPNATNHTGNLTSNVTNDNVGPTSSPQLGTPLHALTPSPAPPPAPSHQLAAALLDPSPAPLGHSPPAATPAANTLIVAKPPTSPDPAQTPAHAPSPPSTPAGSAKPHPAPLGLDSKGTASDPPAPSPTPQPSPPDVATARRLLQLRRRIARPAERSEPVLVPVLEPAPPYRLRLPSPPPTAAPAAQGVNDPFAVAGRPGEAPRGIDPRDLQAAVVGAERLSRLDALAQHSPRPAVRTTPAGPGRAGQRRLLDTFGDSLKFVNHLFTVKWGHHPRKVPAHMPHMIDRDVMAALWREWPAQWEATSAAHFRSAADMQFAFSHFYYIVHAKAPVDPIQFFQERLDINGNGYLEPQEFRRLAVLLFDKKVTKESLDQITVVDGDVAPRNATVAKARNTTAAATNATGAAAPNSTGAHRSLLYLDEDDWGYGAGNIAATSTEEKTETGHSYYGWDDDDLVYGKPKGGSSGGAGANRSGGYAWDSSGSRYSSAASHQEHGEPTMPKEYLDAVARVVGLATGGVGLLDATRFVASGLSKLVIGDKQAATYKHQLVDLDEVSFFMIRDNSSTVQHQMDHILAKQPKFICINDNMNHSHPENSKVVAVIHDFFEIYFPWRSSFELPAGKTNPYQYLDDMAAARKARRKAAGKFSAAVVCLVGLAVFYSFVGLNAVLHWRPGHRRQIHDRHDV